MPVEAAKDQLTFALKHAALPLLKLVKSAVANATSTHKMDEASLIVKTVTVDQGPVLKRYRPRAFGRAAEIRKRTSHITIVLTDSSPATAKLPHIIGKAASGPLVEAKDIHHEKRDKLVPKDTAKPKAQPLGKTKRISDTIVPRQGTT